MHADISKRHGLASHRKWFSVNIKQEEDDALSKPSHACESDSEEDDALS